MYSIYIQFMILYYWLFMLSRLVIVRSDSVKNKKLIIICLLVVALLVISNMSGLFKNTNLEGVKNYILSFGVLAPAIYIIMFTLVPLTLFPDSVLAVAGGTVFGLFWGTVYTIIGAAIGGTLSFYISRTFGRDTVEKLIKHKAKWLEDGVEKQGFMVILASRLIPLIPFDIISYGAGLSKIKYAEFISASVIGVIPGVLAYTNLGDKAVDIYSWKFILSVLILLALCAVSLYVKKGLHCKAYKKRLSAMERQSLMKTLYNRMS